LSAATRPHHPSSATTAGKVRSTDIGAPSGEVVSTEEFLTVAEVAPGLRLNEQTVRNQIDDRTLPAFRIGRRVRAARSDFDRLMQSGYSRAASASPEDNKRTQSFRHGTEASFGDIQEP
jgi:excisionase family DNA binding protein